MSQAPALTLTVGCRRGVERPRVGVVCDFPDEEWHSMNLVGDMLLQHLRLRDSPRLDVDAVRPEMVRACRRLPLVGRSNAALNTDRLLGRYWQYPSILRSLRAHFDVFHILDHSYAHLVEALPAARTIVTCHDVDAFRATLAPRRGVRGRLLRRIAAANLSGLRRAAVVVCASHATKLDLLAHGWTSPERAVVVWNGVHPSCKAEGEPEADREAEALVGAPVGAGVELLHVGSTVPRKRIDVLLRVFAGVRRVIPEARLIRVGGDFTPSQKSLVRQLEIGDSISVLPFLSRPLLAAMYRRAALVLQTSEREGFGLPVAEAMACATPVIASDLAALREVGGNGATYCPSGDVETWTSTTLSVLGERFSAQSRWAERRAAALVQSRRFSWMRHAEDMAALYHRLALS